MTEFKPYVERRKRVEAFQFADPSQAEFVARVLQAEDYVLHATADGWTFHLDVVIIRDKQMIEARVDRGDFLVRSSMLTHPYYTQVEIVKPNDFRLAWEAEDK